MSENLTTRVNFDIIRYANCWEDADILIEGLAPQEGDKILSIGSAGDNSFSLLASGPALVVAVDVNKTQLYLVELKKVAIAKLDYDEVLAFLGFISSDKREAVFQSIKRELSADARGYWDQHMQIIRDGVIYSGKFEHYFQMFSGKILPYIHSRKKVQDMFLPRTEEGQQQFYHQKWNTWRWRLLFKVFFSKYVMGKFGRDPEFLKEVKVSVHDYVFAKAGRHLQSKAAQTNFMLHFNLTGNFGSFLPNYLQREHFDKIKVNLDNLAIEEGYAQDVIGKYGKFNCMNLSNIFEYMNNDIFRDTALALVKGAEHNCRLGYWNLMVPRRVSEILPEKVEYLDSLSAALSQEDKGFFYSQFIVDRIK